MSSSAALGSVSTVNRSLLGHYATTYPSEPVATPAPADDLVHRVAVEGFELLVLPELLDGFFPALCHEGT